VNLLQHARQRFDPIIDPIEGWPLSPYFGTGRPIDGQERPVVADFLVACERIFKRNGPIAALMFVRQMVFSEARFQFRQMRNGRPGDLFGNQDLALLEEPWTNGTTGDLLSRMIQDADLAGNAFLTVVNGQIKRLRPDWVTIVTGSQQDPDLYGDALDGEILGYIYSPRAPGSATGDVLFPEQVAHYAPIPDPEFHYRGMSWLTPIIREIEGDSAATQHKLNFFKNGASPQIVATLDASVKPESFERFRAAFDEGHRGVMNAYKTVFLGGGADVKVVGADLRQLDFKATQGAGESRLAAAAGVPPVIVGFSEGLAGSSLNAGNYAASRRRFADATLRPLWRQAAGALATIINVPAGAQLWYDDRDISFLREDRKDAADIQSTKAVTIRQLVDAGYEPTSVVAAVEAEDMGLLRHSGLYSVQLQAPGAGQPPAVNGQAGAPTTAPTTSSPGAAGTTAADGGQTA
jgi:phage portal protein BeeE